MAAKLRVTGELLFEILKTSQNIGLFCLGKIYCERTLLSKRSYLLRKTKPCNKFFSVAFFYQLTFF